jgi:hypothetical protein
MRYTIHIKAHRISTGGSDGHEVRYRIFFVAGGSREDKKASTKTTKYNNEFFMSEFILLYQIQQ